MALGAGAGAFQGDTAREQASQNRARLAEQQRQFNIQMQADQERLNLATFRDQRDFEAGQQRHVEGMKLEDRNFQEKQRQADIGTEFNIHDRNFQQQQATEGLKREDRNFQEKQRQADIGAEFGILAEKRAAVKSEWDQVLAAETLKKKQAEFEQAEGMYKQFQQVQQAEREQVSNRERLAKTGGAALLRLAYEGDGIVAKAAIDLFNKQNGTNFTGAYLDPNTGIFVMEVDDGNGQIIPKPMDPTKQETALRQIYGDSVAESFFKNRRQPGAEKPQTEMVSEQQKLWKEKIETLSKARQALQDSGIDTASVDKQIAALANQTPGTRQEEQKPIQPEKLSGGRVKIAGRIFKKGDTIIARDGSTVMWDGETLVTVN